LKLEQHKALSNFAFEFNLRRYTAEERQAAEVVLAAATQANASARAEMESFASGAGAQTRSLFSST
jgi:hypothetical protein